MTRYIVTNNTTETTIVYYDRARARAAAEELSMTTKFLWFMRIERK